MPHFSGTFTVGLSTSNFLTLNDAFGDYNGGVGGLTGNLTYIIEGNTTLDTTLATRAIYFQKMNGFTFTITVSKYHYGLWGNGIRLTLTGTSDMQVKINASTALDGGTVIIERLEITGRRIDLLGLNNVGLVAYGKHIVRNCLMSGTPVLMQYRNRTNSGNSFYNNKMVAGSILNLTEYSGTQISQSIVENNTFYLSPVAGQAIVITAVIPATADSQIVLRNNVIFSSSSNDISISAYRTMPYAYNNAFSANGNLIAWRPGSSGNIGLITIAQFESVISSNRDFLKLIKTDADIHISGSPRTGSCDLKTKFENSIKYTANGLLSNAGMVPVLSIFDIAGQQWGKYGFFPIGCYNSEIDTFGEVWEI